MFVVVAMSAMISICNSYLAVGHKAGSTKAGLNCLYHFFGSTHAFSMRKYKPIFYILNVLCR